MALHIASSLERTPCCVRRLLFGTAFRLSTVAASRPATSASIPASVHGTIPHEVAAPISFYGTPALQESKAQNSKAAPHLPSTMLVQIVISSVCLTDKLDWTLNQRCTQSETMCIHEIQQGEKEASCLSGQLYDQVWLQLSIHAVSTGRSLVCARQLVPIASSGSLQ